MRIGLLTDVYRIGFSGVANHVMLLKRWLEANGDEVNVFAFEKPGRPAPEPGVVYSPGVVVKANYPLGLFLSRSAAGKIRQMDILHVHQPFASGSVALWEQKQRPVPIVFTCHTRYDILSHAYLPTVPTGISTFAVKQWLRWYAQYTDMIVAPSSMVVDMLREWNVRGNIQEIGNGINLASFRDPNLDIAAARARLGIPPGQFVFLYLGRIAPEKNLPFLVEAFRRLPADVDNFRLLLVGSGIESARIQRLIDQNGLGDKVTMTGAADYQRVPEVMRAADVFVMPSKSDTGRPLALLEASAAGLPIIAIDSPGLRPAIQEGVTGFFCPDDPAAFAEMMLLLARSPELRQRMSQNARHEAEKFSHEEMARKTRAQYQEIVERQQAGKRLNP